MKYGLGSNDPEELAYYNKIKEEMDDMKKDTVKKGILISWNKLMSLNTFFIARWESDDFRFTIIDDS